MAWDIATFNEEWLIDLCHKAEKERGVIGGLMEGDRVIKVSDHIAVKYGYGVTAAEAATQEFAYDRVDSNSFISHESTALLNQRDQHVPKDTCLWSMCQVRT